jgi:hypothetical protein
MVAMMESLLMNEIKTDSELNELLGSDCCGTSDLRMLQTEVLLTNTANALLT